MVVGVLGSSRSTTGPFGSGRGGATGRPQARYSPCGPAPHSASRRVTPRSQPRMRLGAPSGSAADGLGAAEGGCGRAAGAGGTDRSATGRWAGPRGAIGRSAVDCSGGRRYAAERRDRGRCPATIPSARSRTSIRPARVSSGARRGVRSDGTLDEAAPAIAARSPVMPTSCKS
jgi:hypothetical protein